MYQVRTLGALRLELFEQLQTQISFSDFCAPRAMLEFSAYDGFLTSSLRLFKLTYPGYELEASVKDGMVFIRRNDLYQHSEQYTGREKCRVAIQWDVASIGCGVWPVSEKANDIDKRVRAVHTPITLPPDDLVRLLRTENLLVNSAYRTADDMFVTVFDCLHLCEADIRRHGAERYVWGKNGDMKRPLDEPDISRFVAAFLSSHGGARNFDVCCEPIAGSGNIDFYVVGPVQNKGLAKIAMEAKKADSPKLEHGFQVQLPEYMERIGTQFGIFITYWLKSIDYPYPVQENYGQLEIEVLHPIKMPRTVRPIGLNLSNGPTPSKSGAGGARA
jgi:hypothetical protein